MTDQEPSAHPSVDLETERLTALRAGATKALGEGAVYTYMLGGEPHSLTLDEAIRICGPHIARASTKMVVGMLISMNGEAVKLQEVETASGGSDPVFTRSLDRGRAYLATLQEAES